MDSSIHLFGVFATPALTFCFFWLLETIKSARQNKLANIRALRYIWVELNENKTVLSDEQNVYKTMFVEGIPIIIKNNTWEMYCGRIIIIPG